jgi:pyrroline-5-carboxylate reductase
MEKTPKELRIDVSSPGGTTLKAIEVFDSNHLAGIIAEAMEKCEQRAFELGK